MSQRPYHKAWTQGVQHVDYPFTLNAVGSTGGLAPTGPTLGEGDPGNPLTAPNTVGSYVKVVRGTSGMAGMTGVTGTYVVTTLDPFVAHVYSSLSFKILNQSSGSWTCAFGKPVHNADNTFSIPFTIFNSGTATDLPGGDGMYVWLKFRNSTVQP